MMSGMRCKAKGYSNEASGLEARDDVGKRKPVKRDRFAGLGYCVSIPCCS